ncbi:MAG: hypothetical protein ACRELB_10295 [Polyangiaceae bacterium]
MRPIGLLTLLALAPLGCGGSGHASGTGSDGGSADAASSPDGPGAADGAACTPPGDGLDAGAYPIPTPASIQFAAKAALPSGEQLLFNDWSPSPNTVSSLTPDGLTKTEVFDVYRAWSMGVSHDGKSIAFSCGEPDQLADFGLQIGDSIQQTWIYDASSQAIHLVAHGNINDECHTFGPGDTTLWVCRRYDFEETGDAGNLAGTNGGYRVGWIDLATGAFSFFTPDDSSSATYALYPQPTADGAGVYYSTTQNVSATQTKSTLLYAPLCGGPAVDVRDGAREPVISPDGTRYVYASDAEKGALHASTLDGVADVKITAAAGTNAVWSPDGSRVAYLVYDVAAGCQHIDVVKSDGTTAASPTRLRDCTKTGEFITQLAWFVGP